MVKKIRLIPENDTTVAERNSTDFNNEILELAKTMDWKLWEILQSVQRLETRLDELETDKD
ncbi:hypothetical protein N9E09_01440 [bacterium]|jgi:hypothetical protein|nr:hypothetical protein [bacterium]